MCQYLVQTCMSIKIHFQFPEPAVLCVVYALLAAWDGPYQSIVCCVYENLYHDPRHKVGVCHVSSIVTQFWNISTPRPHIWDAASYYATVIANLLVRGNLRAVHFTRHNLMLKWASVFYWHELMTMWGEQTTHRRHLTVRRRIMSSDKWHVFVVTTETFAWEKCTLAETAQWSAEAMGEGYSWAPPGLSPARVEEYMRQLPVDKVSM